MITFLVRFGFEPRYVLSRDLLTVDGMYASAMRCTYMDKSEDLISMVLAVSEAMNGSGKEKVVQKRLAEWGKIIGTKQEAKSESVSIGKIANAVAQIGKKRRGANRGR